jgi:hypothetical protein
MRSPRSKVQGPKWGKCMAFAQFFFILVLVVISLPASAGITNTTPAATAYVAAAEPLRMAMETGDRDAVSNAAAVYVQAEDELLTVFDNARYLIEATMEEGLIPEATQQTLERVQSDEMYLFGVRPILAVWVVYGDESNRQATVELLGQCITNVPASAAMIDGVLATLVFTNIPPRLVVDLMAPGWVPFNDVLPVRATVWNAGGSTARNARFLFDHTLRDGMKPDKIKIGDVESGGSVSHVFFVDVAVRTNLFGVYVGVEADNVFEDGDTELIQMLEER